MATRSTRTLSTATLIAVVLGVSSAVHAAQGEATALQPVTGTWTMTVMSHQLGLELEQDGKKVTGTLLMMGSEVALKGEFVDGLLTLTGDAQLMMRPAPDATANHGVSSAESVKLEIRIRPSADGTLAGEMPGPQGETVTFVAERLRARRVRAPATPDATDERGR